MPDILGFIACMVCKSPNSVRVSPDKNGEPFGYCEACKMQYRIGGNPNRVNQFKESHPDLFKKNEAKQSKPPEPEKKGTEPNDNFWN